MKLIIDIDDKIYNDLKNRGLTGMLTSKECECMNKSICNGTPIEEKIGHWIRQKGIYGLADTCECSVCGRTIYAKTENDLKDYPYCHCGAKMKGE